jgi:hypothetical protein
VQQMVALTQIIPLLALPNQPFSNNPAFVITALKSVITNVGFFRSSVDFM